MCPLTLIEQLKLNNDSVNKFILDFLPERDKVNEIQNFYDMMRDYPSRPGIGLRSSLCILTCETFGGERFGG